MSVKLQRPSRFKDLSVENWNLAMEDHAHQRNSDAIVGFINEKYIFVLTYKNDIYIKNIYKYNQTNNSLVKIAELQA